LDPVKILIFVAAFLLLLFLGRLLSAHAETRPSLGPGPLQPEAGAGLFQPQAPPGPVLVPTPQTPAGKAPATGAEFGFPVPIPPVKQDQEGKFNRPYFLNYYFSKTDLDTGPPDPTCFCDDFYLQAQDPGNAYVWNYKYVVATPSGLQKLMNTEAYASLYFDDPVVVVSRWDLRMILSTVVEEIMKSYGKTDLEESAEGVLAPE
jgi:hypothetical protein